MPHNLGGATAPHDDQNGLNFLNYWPILNPKPLLESSERQLSIYDVIFSLACACIRHITVGSKWKKWGETFWVGIGEKNNTVGGGLLSRLKTLQGQSYLAKFQEGGAYFPYFTVMVILLNKQVWSNIFFKTAEPAAF